ncbi:uncharacterized protein LOC128558494 [Mercenaria mercenaria]|uniref:uncharacterized protein LOC128558494 n=1 Tax=Mercenaria mercenaria TaxID=6596 RepID=UPI00234F8D40|nr:uncharacterized protein LOC128558494 [Mercenaria mercenaria]
MAVSIFSKFNKEHKSDKHTTGSCTFNVNVRKQSKCSGGVIFVCIPLQAMLIALVAFVGYFSYQDAYHNIPLLAQEYITELSVYCDDISLSPDDNIETFNTKKNNLILSVNSDDGRYICTYKNKDAKKVVNTVVERTLMQTLARGLAQRQYLSCGNNSLAPTSGHLTFTFSGVSQHQKYEGNGKDLALHWDKHPEHSYIVRNIHYHNGEITIPEGRTYYIYASVHFNISRGDDKIDRPRKITLRICRMVYGYEQTLLGKTQLFDVSHGDVVSSLDVGSYLQMSRNDTIYVKVSDAFSIIRGSRGNTFGMFPLSA